MAVVSFRSSDLFKALPFHTSDFLDNDGEINAFKEVESRLAGLCDAVMRFDTSVKTLSAGDANFMKLLYFKKWFLPDSNTCETVANKQSEAYAIEAILAHRLLEAARIVYDPRPSGAELVKPIADLVKLMKDQQIGHVAKIDAAIEAFRSGPMKHMDLETDGDMALNVFEVCKEAKKLLMSHWDSKARPELQKEEDCAVLDWEDHEVDVRLWKGIADNAAEVEARSILLNVEIAAAHIRLLVTKRSLHTPPLAELQKEHPACKEVLSKNHFHRSLWIALSISPVFLLRKFDISKMFQLNTHNIFDFWTRSAMPRGDTAFLHLEKKIWRMLFEIALGQPTKSALEGLFNDLDKSTPVTRLVIPLVEVGRHADRRPSKHQKSQKRKAKDYAENTPRKKVNLNSGLRKAPAPDGNNVSAEASSEPTEGAAQGASDAREESLSSKLAVEASDVASEPSGTLAVGSSQGSSDARGVNWSSTSEMKKTGHAGRYDGGSAASSSYLSEATFNLPAAPGQRIFSPEPSSYLQVEWVQTPELGGGQSKGGEESSMADSPPLQALEPGLNEVFVSLPTFKATKRTMVKKMEQRLADALPVPVFISYVPRRQQEQGWPKLNLETKFNSELYQGSAEAGYLPNGASYTPAAHSLLGLERITQLFKRAKLPNDSSDSNILKFSRVDWSHRSAEDQQRAYSKTEVVIFPEHYSQPEFGRRLLLSIAGSSQRPVPVYDLSVTSSGVSGEKRVGNVDLILAHSKSSSGSILYSINIPSIGASASDVFPEEAIATDLCAFQATAFRQYCGFDHPYPYTSMRWNFCGLKHALKPFSWAAEGLGTYFQVASGRQVLYVAKPVSDDLLAELPSFASLDLGPQVPDAAVWEIQAQVLEAGSIWPYALLNLEHTVCRGGFLYTWATIKDTCYGVYHSFFTNQGKLSPELSWEFRTLLQRLVTYCHLNYAAGVPQTDFPHHVPLLAAFSDVVSLLCLLNVIILGETIYRPHYNDVAAMVDQYKEQLFAKGRQEAQELLNFLTCSYCFTLENRAVSFWQLFAAYLVLHVRCLLRHAALSDKAGGSQRACSPNSLAEALAIYFSNKPWFLEELLLQQKRNACATSYAWKFEEKYSLFRRTDPAVEAEVDLAFPTEAAEEDIARLLKFLSKELELGSVLEDNRKAVSV